ncbi:TonB-dependent receptor [Bacteriovorax sp. Seq25_V]|nr:TonB-dependent receptor [Bacteriovorax sp. Seq25_V]
MLISAQKVEIVTKKNFGETLSEKSLARTSIFLKSHKASKSRLNQKIVEKKLKRTIKTPSVKAVEPQLSVAKRENRKSQGTSDSVARYTSVIREMITKNKKYPRVAKRLKQQGVVKVYFEVSFPNKISNLKIVETAKYDLLNKSALETIESLEDLPQVPDEHAEAPIQLIVPLNFEIL